MRYVEGNDYDKADVVCRFNTFTSVPVQTAEFKNYEYDVLFPIEVVITHDECFASVDDNNIEYTGIHDLDDDDLNKTIEFLDSGLFEKYKGFDKENGYTGGRVMTVYESMEESVRQMKSFVARSWSFVPNVKKAIERLEKRMSEMTIEEGSVLINE
jgi:hypothetical protein